MTLTLGPTYLDREGRLIGPLVPNTAESVRQGFLFKHAHRSYKADGSYRVKNGPPARQWPNRFDLICKVRAR